MRRTTIPALIAVIALLAGCGGDDGSDKAGGEGGITTLEVGTTDRADRPGSDALAHIAQDVEKRSDGRLRLRIVHESQTREGPRNAADADQVIAGQVRDGDLDLGLVSSRGWDVLGVKSFQALQAPFLVDTDDRLGQVVGGEIGDEMLKGVEKAHVVPITLVAESLRHPMGYNGRPLAKLADFEGKQVEARKSDAAYDLLRAFGAEPTWYADEAEFEQALAEERVAGVETSFRLSQTHGVSAPVVTGNVTLFGKANVLVANPTAFGELSAKDQEILRTAAEAERQRSVDELDEAGTANESCDGGTGSVNAKPADLEALRRAAKPVEQKLRADAQTARLVDAIRKLDSSPPVEIPPCEITTQPGEQPTALRGPVGKLPTGTYRMNLTDAELKRRGVDNDGILYNAALNTMEVKKDGTWELRSRPAHQVDTPTGWGGDFSVKGDQVTTTLTHGIDEAQDFRDVYRWSFSGAELTLEPVTLQKADRLWRQLGGGWFAGLPWRKID